MSAISELVEQLPPELQQEARDFVEFLLEKRGHRPEGHRPEEHKPKGKLQLNWAGALRDYRSQFTSLELQKKALEWRGN